MSSSWKKCSSYCSSNLYPASQVQVRVSLFPQYSCRHRLRMRSWLVAWTAWVRNLGYKSKFPITHFEPSVAGDAVDGTLGVESCDGSGSTERLACTVRVIPIYRIGCFGYSVMQELSCWSKMDELCHMDMTTDAMLFGCKSKTWQRTYPR